jgi:hypothetical protein
MKHPVQFVMAGSGGCSVIAAVLFVTGLIRKSAAFKAAGAWFALVAFTIAAIPIIVLVVVLLREKARGK